MKERFKLKNGNILEIVQDEDPLNPRTEWDNLATMVCWHNRYNLGDNGNKGKAAKHFRPPYDDSMSMFSDIAEMENPDDIRFQNEKVETAYKQLIYEEAHKKAIILPLALMDHSGLSMWIGSGPSQFDPGGWDSGQIGWIFVTRDTLLKEGLADRSDEKIEKYLEGEVETYDQYLRGDVYGFRMLKVVQYEKTPLGGGETEILDEEEEIDSCWGFYGNNYKENGLYDHAGIKEADILEEID